MTETNNGLLLQSIPYLGHKKILKVLTAENGLLTFMASKTQSALTTPFVWAEWVFAKDKREIISLKDGTLLDELSALKQDYNRLCAAGRIAQDLLRTQLPGKAAAEPLALALACLRKLPLFTEPAILIAAFRLKLLACEGLLETTPHTELLHSRSFTHLASLPKDEAALRSIDLLFEESLRN